LGVSARRKTIEVGDTPPRKPPWQPLVAWLPSLFGPPADPVDELKQQGWRLVGRDEHGSPIYAPPPRYSFWI